MTNRYEAHLQQEKAWKIYDHFQATKDLNNGTWLSNHVWVSTRAKRKGVELWFPQDSYKNFQVFYRKWKEQLK